MTKTMRIITLLLLMVVGAGQTWADSETVGHITYTRGAADHGTLTFHGDGSNANSSATPITVGADLTPSSYYSATTINEAVKDDNNNIIGYKVYIHAVPDFGYALGNTNVDNNDPVSFIQAEVVTQAQQAPGRRTLEVGQKVDVYKYENGVYYFTLPADPSLSVRVTASFPVKAKNTEAISYIGTDGTQQTLPANTAYVIDGTEGDNLTLGNPEANSNTWYVLNFNASYCFINLAGKVNLILANGNRMDVGGSFYGTADGSGSGTPHSLAIYGQSRQYVTQGNPTANDCGQINLSGEGFYNFDNLAIYGGHIVSNDGSIAGINTLTMAGGKVEWNSYNTDAINVTTFNYTGGQFALNSGISAYTVTLGWSRADDYFRADSYGYPESLTITTGQRFVAFNAATGTAASTIVSGTVDNVSTLAGKTLKPLDGPVVSIGGEDFSFGKDADFVIGDTHYYKYAADDNVTLSYTGSGFVQVTGATLAAVANEPLQRTFTMAASDVALTATAVTDLTATDIIYGEATPEIKQGDDVFATANYAFVYKSGDEVITEPTVGTYTCTLTGLGQYFGTTNVAIKVKPRPITIAAGSATKKYDGTPLTSPYYECTLIDPDDRLNGIPILNNDCIANLTITGSQTNVGESANVPSNAVITRQSDKEDITSCYDITYCNGTLEVITNDTLITVIPGSGSKYYDGTPLTMTAHDDFDVTGVPEVLTWEATADGIVTNVTPGEGEKSENAVTSFKIFDANHVDVTSYFTNIDKDQVGTLTILPRQTTIAVVVDNANTITAGGDARVKVTLVPVKKEEETTELPMINGIATISVSDGINEAKSYNVAIVNGVGHYYVPNLAPDAYAITVSYDGDANHAGSTSDPNYSIAVSKVKTAIKISFDETDVTSKTKVVTVGEPVTVYVDLYTVPSDWDGDFAKASPFNSDAIVTVTARLSWKTDYNDHYTLGLVDGHGSITFSHLPADECHYNIFAAYAGDDNYQNYLTTDDIGGTLKLTVNKTETTIGVSVTSPVIAK